MTLISGSCLGGDHPLRRHCRAATAALLLGLALLTMAVLVWIAAHLSPHHGVIDVAVGVVGVAVFLIFFVVLSVVVGVETAIDWLSGLF